MYREPCSVRSQEPRLRRGKTIENRVGLMGNWQWAVGSQQLAVGSGHRAVDTNFTNVTNDHK